MLSPVRGLRPVRALRLLVRNVPNPAIRTTSSPASASAITSNTASTAPLARACSAPSCPPHARPSPASSLLLSPPPNESHARARRTRRCRPRHRPPFAGHSGRRTAPEYRAATRSRFPRQQISALHLSCSRCTGTRGAPIVAYADPAAAKPPSPGRRRRCSPSRSATQSNPIARSRFTSRNFSGVHSAPLTRSNHTVLSTRCIQPCIYRYNKHPFVKELAHAPPPPQAHIQAEKRHAGAPSPRRAPDCPASTGYRICHAHRLGGLRPALDSLGRQTERTVRLHSRPVCGERVLPAQKPPGPRLEADPGLPRIGKGASRNAGAGSVSAPHASA